MHPPKPGHTSLSVCGSRARDVCLAEAAAEEVECGGTVNLLSSNYKVVGTVLQSQVIYYMARSYQTAL